MTTASNLFKKIFNTKNQHTDDTGRTDANGFLFCEAE